MNITEAFEFREATFSDVRDLAIVVTRANAQRDHEPIPETIRSYQTYDDIFLRMHRVGAWTYAAVCGEKVVGFALSHPVQEPEYSDAEHLSLLMVDPDYWGRRVASTLIDATAARARDAGKRCLTLWTREANNERARAVYTHKGFTLTGISRFAESDAQVQYQLDL